MVTVLILYKYTSFLAMKVIPICHGLFCAYLESFIEPIHPPRSLNQVVKCTKKQDGGERKHRCIWHLADHASLVVEERQRCNGCWVKLLPLESGCSPLCYCLSVVYASVQRQTTVTAYFSSEQLLQLPLHGSIPANTKHLYNIYTTSAQRLRRWSNIVKMVYK